MTRPKILLVDDEVQLVNVCAANFPAMRWEVRTAYDGAEALRQVAAERPDLIVLDVGMPGISGWDVLKKLREVPRTRSIPVIMCTAHDSEPEIQRSFREGAQSYILKPFEFEDLLKKIQSLLAIQKLLKD